MIRRPPRSTRTDTLFPYTSLFRSWLTNLAGAQACGRESLVFLGKFYCAVHKNPLDCLRTWDYITVTPVFCAMQHLSAGLIPRGMRSPIMAVRSEEHTSELQSLMRISYAVFCLKKNKTFILIQ